MKAAVAKYWIIFITQWKNLFAYRMNILLKLVRPLVMTATIATLWYVLLTVSDKETLGGFTLVSFIVYLLVIRFIAVFSPGAGSVRDMNEEIQTGDIMMRLVRPVHYLAWLFSRNFPVPLASGIIGLFVVTFGVWLFGAAVPTGFRALLFIASVMVTIVMQYAIYQGMGVLSFWIYDIWPVERFQKTVTTLLSGEIIPLTLFPSGVQAFLEFLPFAGLAYIPAAIYIGMMPLGKGCILVLVQLGWAILLWMVVLWLYKKGVQKFEAQGG
jgi:ABC-2 type transport system permease protein